MALMRLSSPVQRCAVWAIAFGVGPAVTSAGVLFDNTKAEQAGNADWVIDSDGTSAQRVPNPAQSAITATTAETYWRGGISAWGVTMVKRGQAVETLPTSAAITYGSTTNVQDLSKYSVYAVVEPNSLFTAAEKTAIMSYVRNGGSLFMVADHGGADRDNDGVDAVDAWNDLITTANTTSTGGPAFNFSFNGNSVSPATPGVDTVATNPITNGPAGAATNFSFSSGSLLTISSGATNVKGAVWSTSTKASNAVMVAYGTYGLGKFVAVGDSSPFDDGTGASGDTLYNGWTGDAAGVNDATLITNATLWLADLVAAPSLYYTGPSGSSLAAAGSFSTTLAGTTPAVAAPGANSDVFFASTTAPAAGLAGATVASSVTINSLTFGTGTSASNPVTLGGAGTITINAGAVGYAAGTGLVKQSGSAAVTINAPLALAASQSWTNNSATALTVGGGVNLGTRTLTIAGTNAGGTTLNGQITGSGAVSVTAGGVTTLGGANTYTGGTTLSTAGATLRVNAAATTSLLSGTGTNVAAGTIEFQYTGTSPAATIRGLLAAAYNAPTTPGVVDTGTLRSSNATATKGVGYKESGAGSVVVKLALFGDADLDGGVSINDFNALAGNFGAAGGKVWTDGDFDYDGGVSINDFNLLAGGFGQSLPLSSEAWAGLLAFAAAHDDMAAFAAVTGVPEPATLGLIAASATLGLRRRRR